MYFLVFHGGDPIVLGSESFFAFVYFFILISTK